MIKRIIFDIDGTLIKGVNFKQYVSNTLKQYGIDDSEQVNKFIANIKTYEEKYSSYNRDLYLAHFSNVLGVKLNSDFLEIFFNELKNAVPKDSSKVKDMLDSLTDYELVLLSNYFEESQRNRLTTMNINNYFTEYYGEKIIKPNEEVYMKAKGIYVPQECIIVGDDRLLDIEIPKRLGFNTIYVNEYGNVKTVEEITPQLIKKYN